MKVQINCCFPKFCRFANCSVNVFTTALADCVANISCCLLFAPYANHNRGNEKYGES